MLAEHRRRRKGSAGGAQTKQTNQMGNKNILEKRNQIKIVEDEHRVRRRRVRHGGGRTTVTERETMVLRKGVKKEVKKKNTEDAAPLSLQSPNNGLGNMLALC